MTSAPVTNQSSFFMDVTKTDVRPSDGKRDTEFKDMLASHHEEEKQPDIREDEPKAVKAPQKADKPARRIEQAKEEAEAEKPETEPSENVLTEIAEEATAVMMTALAEEMNISVPTLQTMMEDAGIEPVELLDTSKIPDILVNLTGAEDRMSLLTDQNLYESLETLTQLSEDVVKNLADDAMVEASKAEEFIDSLQPENNAAAAESELIQTTAEDVITEDVITEDAAPVKLPTAQEDDETIPLESRVAQNAEASVKPEEAKAESSGDEHPGQNRENHGTGAEASLRSQPVNASLTPAEFTDTVSFTESIHTEQTAAPDTEMIMRQITEYIRVQSNLAVSEIEMQLHPASLGTVNLQLTAKEGTITAQFYAENEAVRAALESQVTELKENLENQGFKVEAVEVAVGNYSQQQFSGTDTGNEGQNRDFESRRTQRVRRITLDDLEAVEEELPEDTITVDMMRRQGNKVDYLA